VLLSNGRTYMPHTFTLARSDFLSFQKEVGKLIEKNQPSRGWRLLWQVSAFVFFGLAVSTFSLLYDRAYEYRPLLAVVGGSMTLALVMLVVAIAVSTRLVQRHFLRDGGMLLTSQTILLEQEGLTSITLNGAGLSRFAWAAFIGRTEDEKNFYLFLEPSYGFIIPKSAVADSGLELIQQRLKEL